MFLTRRFIIGLMTAAILAFSAPVALAHAHLETSTPAENSTVASPSRVTLVFTEALEGRFSAFEITNDHGHAVSAPSSIDPTDARVLAATPASPLEPGVYHVNWHIVAHDGHRMRGTFDFTVRN